VKLISLRDNWHFPRPSCEIKGVEKRRRVSFQTMSTGREGAAASHRGDNCFRRLPLYPIKFFLLQVVHCKDDRDKIDYRYQ
jgi:hypothetical protein